MKTEDVAESHQTDFPYTFPAGHETKMHGYFDPHEQKTCAHLLMCGEAIQIQSKFTKSQHMKVGRC